MPQAIGAAVGLLLFNAGAGLALTNFVALTLVPALVSVGIGTGLSLAAGALLRQRSRTAAIKPSDALRELRQEVSPRRKSFGTLKLAGSVWWIGTAPTESDKLFIGHVYNHGRCSEILRYYVDDNIVEVAGDGEILTSPYDDNAAGEVHYIESHLGAATESDYSEIASRWALDDARGDGLMTTLSQFDNHEDAETQLEVFPNGVPEIRLLLNTSVVFDPRESGHDIEDESTWEFSDNPVVCLFHYLFVDADGFGISYARVADNLGEWTAAMDVCDEEIDLSSGNTERLYRLAMSYYLTDDPVDVAGRIMASCDARIWPGGDGQIHISVGRFTTPQVAIASADIVGYRGMARGRGGFDRVAGVRAQYMSPLHDYVEQDAEAWPDGSTVAELSGDRTINLDLTTVPSRTQARRLMKREYLRQNADWRGTIITNLAGLRARDQRFINVNIDELGIADSFEVNRFLFDAEALTCQIDIASVDEAIDAWDEDTEEGSEPSIDPLSSIAIDPDDHTAIGSMSDLADAFDGDISEASGGTLASESMSGTGDECWIGLSFASPKSIKRVKVYGTTDRGFAHGSGNPPVSVDLTVRGANGSTPTSGSDGTLIGTLATFIDAADESAGREIFSTDPASQWDHLIVRMQLAVGSGQSLSNAYIVEVEAWE